MIFDLNSYYTINKSDELGFGHNHSSNKGYVPYDVAAVIGEPVINRTFIKLASESLFIRYTRLKNEILNTYPLDLIWQIDVASPDISRLEIWIKAINFIKQKPLFGYGFFSSRNISNEMRNTQIGTKYQLIPLN